MTVRTRTPRSSCTLVAVVSTDVCYFFHAEFLLCFAHSCTRVVVKSLRKNKSIRFIMYIHVSWSVRLSVRLCLVKVTKPLRYIALLFIKSNLPEPFLNFCYLHIIHIPQGFPTSKLSLPSSKLASPPWSSPRNLTKLFYGKNIPPGKLELNYMYACMGRYPFW